MSGATSLTGFAAFVPHHLEIALQDLRAADVSLVQEFYRGRYLLAGRVIETDGRSPFTIPIDHASWQSALHGFGWLRHYSASGDPVAGAHAKALVRDWIDLNGGYARETVWNIETTSRRLISWLNHSIVVLAVPDREFHDLFMRSLGTHVRYLKRYAASSGNGIAELLAYTALSYASVCFSERGQALAFAMQKLGEELRNQVQADGSHLSRNPQVNVDLLALLLPLREGCISSGREMHPELTLAIERLLQGLRFFRLGDGLLCRFNGSGATEVDLVTAIQRYDETLPPEAINGSLGDYQRLQTGSAVLMMDTGAPPRGELSRHAHAGCLSFEFSSADEMIVVNAGRYLNPPQATPAFWRTTAAHSTAVFCETSSCKFENTGASAGLLDGQVFGSSLKPESTRGLEDGMHTITGWHLGYVREFGARHERSLALSASGDRLLGREWFTASDKSDLYYTTRDAATLHFHLHPSVSTQADEEDGSVLLETRSGQRWRFTCPEVPPVLEESIFFAGISGAKSSSQIALHFKACDTPTINWSLQKLT